ncbi:DoxX family protein [Teredinibacter haidensis]|uniref:DoxX family protein n=1 Tax=Teredinibacter haidensis TaxID=2731755 RepID=UPI00094895AC|nr:DoxX family protein [Teredinibacter haidensis]
MKMLRILDNFAKSIGDLIPEFILNVAARISVFMIFWLSAQTKIGGATFLGQKFAFWDISQSTFLLFEYDYDLPIIPAELAAYTATFAEFFVSLLILFGLVTRFSALVFIVMTLIIQFFVYPGALATHFLWMIPLVYLIKNGGGKLSLDRFLSRG